MSILDFKDLLRKEITAERMDAWDPEHPHADIVDFVSDHDCWPLINPRQFGLGPSGQDHACQMAMRYLRLHQLARVTRREAA